MHHYVLLTYASNTGNAEDYTGHTHTHTHGMALLPGTVPVAGIQVASKAVSDDSRLTLSTEQNISG